MKNNLYIIYDKVAKTAFGGTIRVGNDEVARRSFHNALRQKDNPMQGHEKDYCILRIGSMDETTCIIEPQDIPTNVGDGADWIEANKEN